MAKSIPSSSSQTLSGGGATAVVLSVVFSGLASIAVGLRFYARRVQRARVLLEDWLILAALIIQWSYVVVVFLLAYKGGLGWPSENLTPDTLVQSSKYSLAGQTNWPIANALIKVSICLTFIRIFFTRPFRIAGTTIYILSIGWSLGTILVGYLICTPLSELWAKAPEGHCGSTTAAYVSLGVLDIVLDMAVFSLPIPMLYRLQVARHTKIALAATFGLGVFTIAAGIMRLVAVIQIDFKINFTEAQVGDAYWCTIESSVGIIVACALTLRPLLDRLLNIMQSCFSRIRSSNASRRIASSKHATGSSGTAPDNTSFIRLNDDHEELPLELPLQGVHIPQVVARESKHMESFEHV